MKQDLKLFFLLFGISLVLMLVIPSPNFPLNDEWMFVRSVENYFETGIISCEGCTTSGTLLVSVGVLFTQLFGLDFSLLRVFTIALGALSVSVLYLILKEVTKNTKLSFIASLLLLANPTFYNTSHMFTTDVPFLFFAMLAIYFSIKGIKDDKKYFVFAALAASASLFLRQIGIAIPFAILAYFLISDRRMLKQPFVLFAIFLPAAMFGAFSFNQLQSTGQLYSQEFDVKSPFGVSQESVYHSWASIIYFGFFFLPLAYLSRQYFRRKIFIGSLLVLSLVAIGSNLILSSAYPNAAYMPYLGNIMNANGIGAVTIPGQEGKEIFFSEHFWIFVTAVSILSASIISTELISRFRKRNFRSLEFFILVMIAVFLLTNITKTGGFYDRYIMIFIPLLAFIFVDKMKESKMLTRLTIAYIIFLTAISIIGTMDYVKWNEVRWQEIESLKVEGVGADEISGGFEYCLYNHGMHFQYEYWQEIGVFEDEGVRPHDWKFCPMENYVISFGAEPKDFVSDNEYEVHREVEYCAIPGLLCDKIFILKAI